MWVVLPLMCRGAAQGILASFAHCRSTLIAPCWSLFLTYHMPYHVDIRSLTNEAWSFLLTRLYTHSFRLYTHSFLIMLIMIPSGVRMWDHFMLFL